MWRSGVVLAVMALTLSETFFGEVDKAFLSRISIG
jgi:hypothetical protein